MDDLVAILVILVLAPFVALIWLIASVIGLSGKVREMRTQLGELAGRLAIIERHGVAAPVEKPRAAARAAAPVELQAPMVAEVAAPAPPPAEAENVLAPPLQGRGWGGAVPQEPQSPDSRRGPTPSPSPEGEGNNVQRPRPGIAFEDLFGRRLPIWLGGITLAVAGLLIVKYSIDAGLLSPLVRVICGWLFGMALIAGAELALRNPARVVDPRIRQALAGAGVASLYGAILAAVDLYHLIGPFSALAGMAGVTLLAGLLALRFGAPSAVLGLVGGLTAPALIHSGAPHIPALAGYLALAIGGLTVLARSQRWWWLGAASLTGGFLWGVVMLAYSHFDTPDTLAIGGFALLLGMLLPLLIPGEQSRTIRLAGHFAACVQVGAIVALGGFAPLDWALFGLVSAAALWLAQREPGLKLIPPAALVITLTLLLAWEHPGVGLFSVVLAGLALLHGAPGLSHLAKARGEIVDVAMVVTVAGALALFPPFHFHGAAPAILAGMSLLGAGLAALAAYLAARNEIAGADMIAQPVAVGLAYLAAYRLLSDDVLPLVPFVMIAGIALARRTWWPALVTAGLIALAWAAEPVADWCFFAGRALFGDPAWVDMAPTLREIATRLLPPAAAAVLVAWRLPLDLRVRRGAIALAAALGIIAAHVAWKHVFAIGDQQDFVAHGLAERTCWELLLAAIAAGAWRLGQRGVAIGLGVASLAHFVWFTLLLHNPLLVDQAGPVWLIPAYACAFGLIWWSERAAPAGWPVARPRGIAMMALILLFAWTALRWVAHGADLATPGVTAAEDIARSVLALVLAAAFLIGGIRARAQDWRIASLVLIVAAVGKVFLHDAAGLDGLARIASFAALGFSLIGVGWLYARYLPGE
ncbi:MAG: hypothetical protein JWL96_706 [Sphingomonas bacterium]|uniref:DUF2339 domain-containing protein n=1 Tax=Sphingomonas bacterium TaxID=1895847 RepID=UPI0026369E42|nr:DUF2339 domain-containing protein [Sphingomonas bacterium]MDB5708636.1 hypothetical protein [Sphingomonas bacterium]